MSEFYELWKAEHPGVSEKYYRRYQQVVGHLDNWHPNLRLEQLNKGTWQDYLGYLHKQGLADSTITTHIKFLRECHKLASQLPPPWLKIKVKYGRAPSLRREELRALLAVESDDVGLQQEKQLFILQVQLMLRDSDVRRLRPHHVTDTELPGIGPWPVARIYQEKTNDEVLMPLPPDSRQIWQHLGGHVKAPTQQQRNRRIKDLAQLAGLNREFVRVRYHMGKPIEEVLPLWKVITTHTARHTGADMVLLGSNGDQNLKEVALGHAGGKSPYGYDQLERYGPLLLKAWQRVLAETPLWVNEDSAYSMPEPIRTFTNGITGGGMLIRRSTYRKHP